jgi:hypothetical protein
MLFVSNRSAGDDVAPAYYRLNNLSLLISQDVQYDSPVHSCVHSMAAYCMAAVCSTSNRDDEGPRWLRQDFGAHVKNIHDDGERFCERVEELTFQFFGNSETGFRNNVRVVSRDDDP